MQNEQEYAFFLETIQELEKARRKFPEQNVWVTLAALTEEVGELNQAILQFNYEPHKAQTRDSIRKEASQVVTMVLRVLFDCDLKPARPTAVIDIYAQG